MNATNQTPNFTVQPETRALSITKDHETDVRFLVASRALLRGEAHVIPVAVNGNRSPEVTARFAGWLTIIGERELDFDASGEAKPYTVRISVPDDADPGEYSFRLKVVDVAEPDETVGESPEIAFQVIGPKPTLAGFILAAVVALAILTVLAVWAVIVVNNRTNLQFTINMIAAETNQRESSQIVNAREQVHYELAVENKRSSPVERVRLRYELPEGIMGASATVVGAITRHCDELNRNQTILCDLGTIEQDERRTVRFTLLPDPNGPSAAQLTPTVLEGNSGFIAWVRSFFVDEITTVRRDLQGTVSNEFQLSGNEITTRTEVTSFTVERCLTIETSRNDEILSQRICPEQQVHVSIDPAISEATLNEIQPYTIRVWNEHSDKELTDVVVRYQLPERLRYVWNGRERELHPPLDRDEYTCDLEEYFTVACRLHESLPPASRVDDQGIPIQAIELQLASTSAGTIQNSVTVNGILSSTVPITSPEGVVTTQLVTEVVITAPVQVTTNNMNTALRFDGIDDWVELGYAPGQLEDFTVELWLHPFSDENGQSFVGAHTADGQNLFLVGYWPGSDGNTEGLLVNILGEDQVINPIKRTRPHHLAVTVRGDPQRGQYDVVAFVYDAETTESFQFGPERFTVEPSTETAVYSHWVLGQEWDQGSPAPRPSDFFKGTMSEVRIWNRALDERQVTCVRTNRLYVNQDGSLNLACLEPDADAEDDSLPQLMGYWRLDIPSDLEGKSVADLVPRTIDTDDPLHGAILHGGVGWGGIDPRFGTGLLFDGLDNYVVGANITATVVITQQAITEPITLTIEPIALAMSSADTVTADVAAAPVTAEATASEEIAPSEEVPPTEPLTEATMSISLSIATWLYVADGIPTERQWIAGLVGDEASGALVLDETGQIIFIASCGRQADVQTVYTGDTKTVPINTWVHYAGAVTLDCAAPQVSDMRLYRDGSANLGTLELVPLERVPWINCPANFYLGGLATDCNTLRSFKGRMDEVRIWPRRLTGTEIIRWRNRPGEFFDELAYWPFDEGSGNRTNNRTNDSTNDSTNEPTGMPHYPLQLVGPKWIDTNFDLADQGSGP